MANQGMDRGKAVKNNKRVIPVLIYKYLSENSSVNNPVRQNEILDYVNREMGNLGFRDLEKLVDRKTVGRTLIDFAGFGWVKAPKPQKFLAGGEQLSDNFRTGVYMSSGFTAAELKVMMAPMLMAGFLSDDSVKRLLNKVCKLSNQMYGEHTGSMAVRYENGNSFFENVGVIYKAIKEKKQLSFVYNDMDENRQLVKRVKEDCPDGVRVVNPYGIVSNGGYFYFVCSHLDHSRLITYRVDKMTAVHSVEEDAIAVSKVPGYENWKDFRTVEYLRDNYKMWGGETHSVLFQVTPDMPERLNYYINTVWDEFGQRVEYITVAKDKQSFEFSVNVSAVGAKLFALQYASVAELRSPRQLRAEVQETLRKTLEKYGKD